MSADACVYTACALTAIGAIVVVSVPAFAVLGIIVSACGMAFLAVAE